jgi:hypothetical protein
MINCLRAEGGGDKVTPEVMAKKLAVLLETGDKGTGAEFHGP